MFFIYRRAAAIRCAPPHADARRIGNPAYPERQVFAKNSLTTPKDDLNNAEIKKSFEDCLRKLFDFTRSL